MKNETIILLVVFLISIAQCALVSFLPYPLALLNLPLMLASALSLVLRFRTATMASAVFGLVADTLGTSVIGINTISAVLAVAITALLLYRVLTHHTISALAGVNATVFVLFHLIAYLLNGFVRVITGGPIFHPASWYAFLMVGLALPVQLLVAICLRLLNSRLHGYTSRFILVK